ncbi:MAG TPA: GAF domain-containing protein [Ohtaekwangia sp.]
MKKVLALLKGKAIYLAILMILVLMLFTSIFAFRNQNVMKETEAIVKEAEYGIRKNNELLSWLHLTDMGVRGFALGRAEALLYPFNLTKEGFPRDVDSVRAVMKKQGYPQENFEKYVEKMAQYISFNAELVELARVDSMSQFKALMAEDRGFNVWKAYQGFSTDFVKHEQDLKRVAERRYSNAVTSNLIIQIALLVIGIPALYVIYSRIKNQESHRQSLLLNLEQNNRKYVFDPGTAASDDAAEILNSSIQNIKNASGFIKKITSGDFEVTWPGMNKDNVKLNTENLSGIVMDMRDQMKRIQDEDRKRMWTTEGITKFTEIIRQHQDNATALADQATRFLVRYLGAQQGATFVLQEDIEENQFLELSACYAFDKKKFLEKRIDIGQGLIGQTFLEGTTVVLKAVPNGYTHITSGLGEATPSCVLIVPMRYNEKTEGIFELAGFTQWQDYQQSFVEKATEYMAAAISTVRSTQKMKQLVEQMQSQTQQLHAQEEEMRQNMEELSATNEEMKRKEAEYISKLRAVGVEQD